MITDKRIKNITITFISALIAVSTVFILDWASGGKFSEGEKTILYFIIFFGLYSAMEDK